MMNILNGGAHSKNPLDTQEFMIVPLTAFQVVSDHLETLLDSMSMWIADMEDLTQVPLQEHENEDLTGMQMG